MSNIFGTRPASQTVTKYTSLNLQTSTAGVCIPILYGANRVTGNLIWYNNFRAHPVKQGKGGKGGGGKGQQGSYTYSAAVILALAEGPISQIFLVWKDQSTTTLPALNMTLFNGTDSQTPPAWISSNYPAEARSYPDTAYVFSDNYDLGSSSNLPSHNFEAFGRLANTEPLTADANTGDIILDLLTDTHFGLGLPLSSIDLASWQQYRNYCQVMLLYMSPYLNSQEQLTSILQRWAQLTNSFIFWSGNQLKFVPLDSFSGPFSNNGGTYIPSNVPVYNLTLEDFIFDPSSEDPVTVTRSDPADGYNSVQLDINDRFNGYNTNPIYWQDQSSADKLGVLQSQIISASEVCLTIIGTIMASLIGQRAVNIRNTYAFKLPPTYALLEPGDIVQLTEPFLGLNKFAVRILTVAENDKYDLDITAEEYPQGSGTAVTFASQANEASAPPDTQADPGNVNAPLLLEPSPIITAGQPQLWVGLSGGPQWGGAEIWVSTDAINYAFLGAVEAPTPQGLLTAPLPYHADPDTTNTLSVNMAISGQALSTSVTPTDADQFQSVALIDNELIAFGNVIVTGATTYNLTYLRRGVYGTTPAAHATGAEFSFVNPVALFNYTLPASYVAVPLFFKFLSVNLFGNELQDISTVVQYEYVPTGVAYSISPPLSPSITSGGTSLTLHWIGSAGPQLAGYEVNWSTDAVNWQGVTVGSSVNSYLWQPLPTADSYYMRVRAFSQNGMAQSEWANAQYPLVAPTVSNRRRPQFDDEGWGGRRYNQS